MGADEQRRFSYRPDEGLWERLKEEAEGSDTSMNALINRLVRQGLDGEGAGPQRPQEQPAGDVSAVVEALSKQLTEQRESYERQLAVKDLQIKEATESASRERADLVEAVKSLTGAVHNEQYLAGFNAQALPPMPIEKKAPETAIEPDEEPQEHEGWFRRFWRDFWGE